MDFKEYQEKSKETVVYPKLNPSWIYPSLGLSGETGEVMEKLKKILRENEWVWEYSNMDPNDENLKEVLTISKRDLPEPEPKKSFLQKIIDWFRNIF